MNEIPVQVWTLLSSIGTALLAVIAILWKRDTTYSKSKDDRITMLEKKETINNELVIKLTADVSELKGEKAGQELVLEKTLEAVAELVQESQKQTLNQYIRRNNDDIS